MAVIANISFAFMPRIKQIIYPVFVSLPIQISIFQGCEAPELTPTLYGWGLSFMNYHYFCYQHTNATPQGQTMPKRNRYLDSVIPFLYQRQTLDIMAFTFIDSYRTAQPTVTLKEAALAFLKRYKITEDLMDISHVMTVYGRVQKDLYDAEKAPQT